MKLLLNISANLLAEEYPSIDYILTHDCPGVLKYQWKKPGTPARIPPTESELALQKVYDKVYDENTNVMYDMVTTHFFTKQFYVEVWFKTLQYPYKVGFPCYQDAENDSMYHVNNRLDTWGAEFGLPRRLYKTDIDEKEYYKTFPW